MSDRPRATTPARQQQTQLVEPVELERMRCAWRSGLHEPAVGRLLEHIAIYERVIRQIAQRTQEVGTPDEQAHVAAALELADPDAPVHVRLDFDVAPVGRGGAASLVEAIREWTLDEIAALVDAGHATATYRGESETWETRLA